MDNSPLSRLPLELREQILDYLMPTDIKHITSCTKQSVSISSHDPIKDMMVALARRHAFMASCRELQHLGLRLDLRRTEFLWNCSLPLSSSTVNKNIRIQDYDVGTIFHTLPELYSQGFVGSIRSVGAVVSDDYLHRESLTMNQASNTQRQADWTNEPLEIIGMYDRAMHIASRLRTEQYQRELGHHQIFYRQSYRLQAFTDGNAARPIKKALRRTWKRDTVEITIDLLSEETSLQRMRAAISLVDVEHLEKMEVIQIEIDRQVPLSSAGTSAGLDRERSIYVQFLRDMDVKYSRWKQRVKKFHEALIKVVMLGYRSSYRDVENNMERLRAGLEQTAQQACTGDEVVETVIMMIKATKPHDIEPSQHTKLRLALTNSKGYD